MNRDEYLKRLEELLSDINKADRDEAIEYYRSYFNEAGFENEARVIETLGSPEKLSLIIRDGLNNEFDKGIEFGDEGITNDRYENKNEVSTIKEQKMNRKDKMIFLILILCLCVPISSILNGLFGVLGVVASIVLFIFGFWIVTFVLYVLGSVFIAFGVLNLITYLGAGLIFIGIGFLLIALGNIAGKFASWFFKNFIPRVYYTCREWLSSLFVRRIQS